MRAWLWRLEPGPEWCESVRDADPGDEYFARNLEALREILRLRPYEASSPFSEHEVRIVTTKDVAAGYRLVALIRMRPREQTVELGWLMLEDL